MTRTSRSGSTRSRRTRSSDGPGASSPSSVDSPRIRRELNEQESESSGYKSSSVNPLSRKKLRYDRHQEQEEFAEDNEEDNPYKLDVHKDTEQFAERLSTLDESSQIEQLIYIVRSISSSSSHGTLSSIISESDRLLRADFVDSFPVEIVLEIFSYLSPRNLCVCSLVSKTWNDLASDTILWKRFVRENFRSCLTDKVLKILEPNSSNWKVCYRILTQNSRILTECAGGFFSVFLTSQSRFVLSCGCFSNSSALDGLTNVGRPSRVVGSGIFDSPVVFVAVNGVHFGALTESGKLFTWGYGSDGALGHRERVDLVIPRAIDLPERVTWASIGVCSSAAIGRSGSLWTWGTVRCLGRRVDPEKRWDSIPGIVPGLRRVLDVSVGETSVLALVSQISLVELLESYTEENEGSNEEDGMRSFASSHLERGGGEESFELILSSLRKISIDPPSDVDSLVDRLTPLLSPSSSSCPSVPASLPEVSSVSVWIWGSSSSSSSSLPALVPSLSRLGITRVASGSDFFAVLDRTGGCWTWGKGDHGRLGHGSTFDFKTPRRVATLRKKSLSAVSLGLTHSLALTSAGSVWGWGGNAKGQVGVGRSGPGRGRSVLFPKEIPALRGVSMSSVNAGSYHSVAIGRDGRVWSWGCGEDGQLGIEGCKDVSLPSAVELDVEGGAVGVVFRIDRNGLE